MKLNNIFSIAAGLGLALGLSGCEGEKDLIIIEGNLPIKTSALYMVGDATPNGWSIDNPTPLTAEGEDPLIFTWEGELNSGELKLCLTTGSWDAPFIRPKENGREIGRTAITGETFQMHAGDPDEKWKVSEAGTYALTFDLRNWTVSTIYLKEPEAPAIEPIATDALYIVGDATPNGWIIDSPTALEKKSDYVFTYEGALTAGELKACTSTGSWDVPFVRPVSDGSKINRNGAEAPDFVYTTGPDNKWRVEDAGIYRLTFDLQNWTIAAEFMGETVVEKNPIETDALYMIGDATPGGWSLDDAQVFTADPANRYIFSWEGTLVEGTLKACIEKDFGAPFIRPAAADCEISASGAAAPDFVFTKNPDDQWRVTKAGRYRLTFDLQNWTIDAKFMGETVIEKNPIETDALYMIGDATPGGWSLDDAQVFTADPANRYIFSWEGTLVEGTLKACIEKDFGAPFIRPAAADCEISASGAAAPDFVFTKNPDDQWRVTKAGRYRLTFDLQNWTIDAKYLD